MTIQESIFESIALAIDHSVEYLNSSEARESLEADPYWPKWNSPWWHMLLLWELGYASQIPRSAVENLAKSLNTNCVKFFPIRLEDVPEGVDPYRGVPCHCQLGNVYQVIGACGIDVDAALPWIRPWFLRYQLPDGGLNCDEAAYTRTVQKSSIVSTLPPLEAILFCTSGNLTSEEEAFLDRGAQYLLDRQLFRSLSTGNIIDEDWLRLSFPRFYDYDILRGLNFILHWAERLGRTLPREAISEAMDRIEQKLSSGLLRSDRVGCAGDNTWMRDSGGNWSKSTQCASFPLLDVFRNEEFASPFLGLQWNSAKDSLNRGCEAP